ncbi:MAG: hypothetical protein EAX87_14155 [Candidatus Thorarchaeota archaeon]|nr:hypothetical protein [Candidatus Thorarchaeota archaeon]
MGGLTKGTERYRKWFGTKVPSVSRGLMTILSLSFALPFSGLLYLRFNYTIVNYNWLIPLVYTLVIGAMIHIFYLAGLRTRFSNPSSNKDFLDIVSRIHQRVVVPSRTSIWIRWSEEPFIATSFNPLFNAVIVSEPMQDLILQSPESGEVLLAFHLFRVPRVKWFADLIGSTIMFLIFSYGFVLFLIPLVSSIMLISIYGGYWVFILITLAMSLVPYFLVMLLLVIVLKGTFWRHEPAFDSIQTIYGMHPNVAKVQIEEGRVLEEEEAQAVIWAVREWEKSKRSARRVGLSTILAIISFLLGILALSRFYIPYSPFLFYMIQIPLIIPVAVWILSYLILRKWDKNAMGEVFQKTTDYDEPIWMD